MVILCREIINLCGGQWNIDVWLDEVPEGLLGLEASQWCLWCCVIFVLFLLQRVVMFGIQVALWQTHYTSPMPLHGNGVVCVMGGVAYLRNFFIVLLLEH